MLCFLAFFKFYLAVQSTAKQLLLQQATPVKYA